MAYDYSGFDDSFQKLQFGPTDDMRLYNDRLNELRAQRSQFSGGGQGWETWNSRVQQARSGLQNATSAARSAWQQQNAKPAVMQPPPQTNPGTQPGTQPGASGVVQIRGGGTQIPPTSGNPGPLGTPQIGGTPGPVTGSESNPASGGVGSRDYLNMGKGSIAVMDKIYPGSSGYNPTLPQPQPPMPPQQQLWWQMKMQQGQMGFPIYQPNPYQNPYQNPPNGNAYGWYRNQGYPQVPGGGYIPQPNGQPYNLYGQLGGQQQQQQQPGPVSGSEGQQSPPPQGQTNPWSSYQDYQQYYQQKYLQSAQDEATWNAEYQRAAAEKAAHPERVYFQDPLAQYQGGYQAYLQRHAEQQAQAQANMYTEDRWNQLAPQYQADQRMREQYGGNRADWPGYQRPEVAPAPLNQGNMGQYQPGDPRYQTYDQYLQTNAQRPPQPGGGGGGPSYNQPFQSQPLSTPPKPPWLQAIESRNPLYQSRPAYPTPFASQSQWNGMAPSEREGYMSLIPPAYRNDWSNQMQSRWQNMGYSTPQRAYF